MNSLRKINGIALMALTPRSPAPSSAVALMKIEHTKIIPLIRLRADRAASGSLAADKDVCMITMAFRLLFN
jgi:hypothetical protein